MYSTPNVAQPPPGSSQCHSLKNQNPPAYNQNQYPPTGNQSQYLPSGNQNQYPSVAHQNQGYSAIQNPNYPPPYSQPGHGQVIQHQPDAYQPSLQVVADGWMPIPRVIPQNCPNGLEYLSTLNQLLII